MNFARSARPGGAVEIVRQPATSRSIDRHDVVVVLLAIGAAAWLVALGRGLTFFADEWAVIEDRPIGLDSFLAPFNEHWLGIQVTAYRALVELVGLGTYVPYHAVLVALHVVVALEVYVIARRATHAPVAVAVAAVTLLFGSGFENLFWAMQIGFVGAIALGLAALLLLDGRPGPRRAIAATGLLVATVMTSGFGLFMLVLIALDLLLDRTRRHLLPVVLAPAGVWLAWYLALGRAGVAAHGNPFTVDTLLQAPAFVLTGVATAFGSALGLGEVAGLAAAGGLACAVLIAVRRGTPVPRRAMAYAGSILAMYLLLAVVRADTDPAAPLYSRYAYLSGMLALLTLATLLGRRSLRPVPRAGLLLPAIVGAAFTFSLLWNVRLLIGGRELFAERADLTRALVELALLRPLPDGVDPGRSLILVPSPQRLAEIVDRYGSPLGDSLAGDAVRPISAGARSEARRRALNPPDWLLAGCGGSRPQPAHCQALEPSS